MFFFALLFLASSCTEGENQKGERGPKAEESGGPVPGKGEAIVEAPSTKEPTVSFLICRGENIRMRKTPDLKGEVLDKLSRETVLQYLGENAPESEEVVLNGHTFRSSWMKVKTLDSEVEGWVYGAMDRKHGLVDWLQRDSQIDQQSKGGRSLSIWNQEPQSKIIEAFELTGLNINGAKTFSGYSYSHLVNNEKVPNGPFFLSSSIGKDREERVTIEGEYIGGKFSRLLLVCKTPPSQYQISFTIVDGVCTGRDYLEFKGTKRVVKYSDLSCSLDPTTVEYDL